MPTTPHRPRTVAVEEHFSTATAQESLRQLAAESGRPRWWGDLTEDPLYDVLLDLGDQRVAAMDEAGLDTQVLSLSSPGINDFDASNASAIAQDVNDVVAEAQRRHPGRLVGMITVAWHDPLAAAAELERGLSLGLRGAIVNGHIAGSYLDDPVFLPALEAAAHAGIPLYLHPRDTPTDVARYVELPGFAGWSMGVEESIQVAKVVSSGLLDRLPGLRFLVGHLGGGIVFALPRIDNRYAMAASAHGPALQRTPGDYLREHFWVTTSGMLYPDRVRMAIDTLGADHVLLATDYPLEDLTADMATFRSLDLTDDERRQIGGGTAEMLYGLADA